jgi:hypothetical protein
LRTQPIHICRLHSGPVTTESLEEPALRRWGKRQTLAAVAVAAIIGGLGGAAVYAATQGSSHAMPGVMRGQMHGPPPPGPGTPAAAQAPAEPEGVLHSEYVVSDGRGGFTTKMTQTGVVDELTLSQIVVRSDDGYTQIYAFPSASVVPDKSVAAKDTVTVEATRAGATLTLNRIGEGQPPPGN